MNTKVNINDLPNLLWGETEADRINHVRARISFLHKLFSYLEEQKVFLSWNNAAGVSVPMEHMRAISQDLLWLIQSSAPEAEIRNADLVYRQAKFLLLRTLRIGDNEKVYPLIHSYVTKELGLPWEWLVCDLYIHWARLVIERASCSFAQDIHLQYIPTPPPIVPFDFHRLDNEPIPAMKDRLKKEFKQARKEQKKKVKAFNGTLYVTQNVERYVESFFRLTVLREPVLHISLYEASRRKRVIEFDRKRIRDQSKTAREWLSHGFSQENIDETLLEK